MKDHTIIFVPHTRARFRKWRLSSKQIVAAVTALVLLIAVSIFTSWSFFTNTIDRAELERIQQENEQLRVTNLSFEASIQSLESNLDDFEERTRQLAIVAGLENLSPAPDTGIGGGSYGVSLESLSGRIDTIAGNLDRVSEKFDENQRWQRSMPTNAPVRGVLTSAFGSRPDPITGQRDTHLGVDIATAPGREVVAPAAGLVVRAGRIGDLGNAVYLSHGYGVTTRYGHLSKISVVPGQRVDAGATLGLVGSTGKATGYHLHYEVRENGRPKNPIYYLLDWPRASGS